MSAFLEQPVSEIAFLKGATVTKIEVAKEVYDEGDYHDESEAIEMTFRLKKPINVDGDLSTLVRFQIWMDPEGNGPGYLALTGHVPMGGASQ